MITDKKILLSVLTLCILIFGLSMVSAADMNSTSQTQLTHINQSAPSVIQDTVTAQTHDNIKEVNKKTDKSLKQSTITKEVNNYDELDKAVTEADNDNNNNYHIKLNNGSYTYNSTITWGNSTSKKLTINLNNQTLTYNGTSKINIFSITNGYSLNLENQGNSLNIINHGNLTVNTYSGNITNYGNLIIENTTINDSRISSGGNLVFNNCTISRYVDAYNGNVSLNNCTVNSSIEGNYIIVSNDTILNDDVKLDGRVITNRTDIFKYLEQYRGNYTVSNMNITGNYNYNNLTIINSRITRYYFYNQGNLVLINSSYSNLYNYGGNIIFANSKINRSLYNYWSDGSIYLTNHTIINYTIDNSNGNLVISDDTVFLDNARINGRGKIITNRTDIFRYLGTYQGNYTVRNMNITGTENYGNLTIINSDITSYNFDNYGNLVLINSTYNKLRNYGGNITLINSVINSNITNNYGYGNIYLTNRTVINYTINNDNGNLIISDNVIMLDNGKIEGNGRIFTNNTNVIVTFKEYNGTYIFNNLTLIENKTNNANLTLQNCILNCSMINKGSLIISNDTIFGSNFVIDNYGTIITNKTNLKDYYYIYQDNYTLNNFSLTTDRVNNANLTLKRCILNSTIINNATLIISDNTILGSNFVLDNNGTVITNKTNIKNYYKQYDENYTLHDFTLTTDRINNANLTLKRCVLNSTIINNGILIISDDTVIGTNALITGNGTIISNSTYVDSYTKLKEAINNAVNNRITISLLKGSYNSNGIIRLSNQTCKNIIIKGNGQIINGTSYQFLNIGHEFNVTIINTILTGYTQYNGVISNNGTLRLVNTNFTNIHGDYYDYYLKNYANLTMDNSGISNTTVVNVIYSYSGNLRIINSDFLNNNVYDGIFYLYNTTGTISNSVFSSTNASRWGGALYLSNSQVNITSTRFINNNAAHYAGVIYSYNTKLTINDSIFTNNTAPMGGAIVSLNSSTSNNPVLNIVNSSFNSNTATYEGGAIYNVYTNLNITSSDFTDNHARSGGSIYADRLKLTINSVKFSNNHAQNYGGSIFVNQVNINITHTNFTKNSAAYGNDMYSHFNKSTVLDNNTWNNINPIAVNLTRISAPPSIIVANVTYPDNITDIPSKYNLRDYGWVTSIKNQGSDGNCWAFATMATLESCILKATNKSYDFSENNLKDIMATFSPYGEIFLPNDGGNDNMALAYLVNWYGPVLESTEPYTIDSTISPLLDSVFHVTNVYAIPGRHNATDNNIVKEAIMKYGGVYASLYMNEYGSTSYYSGGSYTNHAICIVGWDDNYSRNNFRTTPPGDGAFIIKNSWGTYNGDDGYYYVSYYDTSILNDSDIAGFTFILNDTIVYDNIYQNDYSSISHWHSHPATNERTDTEEFIINGNESLRAFGTYVSDDNTNYTIHVYVNDYLTLIQQGTFNHIGYETVHLDKVIPVQINDTVKITLNRINEKNFSYHTQVLKLYTTNGFTGNDTNIAVKVVNNTINNTVLSIIVAHGGNVLDKGTIIIMENNTIIAQIEMNNTLTYIKLPYNSTGTHNLVVYYNTTDNESLNMPITANVYKVGTRVTVNMINTTEYNDTITITGNVTDEYGNRLTNRNLWIRINGYYYYCYVDNNGTYTYNYKTETIGVNNVTIQFAGNDIYSSAYTYTKFNVTKISTVIKTSNITGYLNNIVTVNATVTNSRGVPVGYGVVEVRLNNRTLGFVNVTGNGLVEYKLNLTKTDYVRGNYTVTFVYNETNISSGRAADTNLEVLPVNITIKASLSGNKVNSSALTVRVYDGYKLLDNGNLTVIENDTVIAHTNMNDTSTGVVLPYISSGVHDLIIRYSTDNLVVDTHLVVSILKISTILTVNNVSDVAYNRTVVISGVLSDEYGSKLNNQNISVSVNNQSYIVITNSTGGYTLSIKAQRIGLNTIQVVYNGSNVYNTTSIHTEFNTEKIITRLELDPVSSVLYDKNTVIAGRLYDADDNPLRNETISIQVNRNKYSTKTGSDGRFTFEFEGVLLGVNNVTVSYPGSSVFSQVTGNTSFNGLKHNSKITVNQVNSTLIDSIINITGKLTDSTNNQTIGNAEITITFNNNTTTVTTDTNGEYTLPVQIQPSTNIIKITYNGNQLYNANENTITFNGLKRDTKLTVNQVNSTLIDSIINITGKLIDSTNNQTIGNAEITITFNNNTTTVTTDTNGEYILPVQVQPSANIIKITYNGSQLYNANENTITFKGLKRNTTTIIEPINGIIGNNVSFIAHITDETNTPVNGGYVIFKVNGVTLKDADHNQIRVNVTNGTAILTVNATWNNAINTTVCYSGSIKYEVSRMENGIINISKQNTAVTLMINENLKPGSDILFDDNILITGTLKDINNTLIDNTYVTITVNGVERNIKVLDGKYSLNIFVKLGVNNITVQYNGNNYYNPSNTTVTFIGLAHNTTLTVNHINDTLFDNNILITGTLKDINNTSIDNANVAITVNSVIYNTTTANGVYMLNISAVPGANNIQILYTGSSKYNPVNTTTRFNGLKHDTKIVLDDTEDVLYDNLTTVSGLLLDVNSTPVANAMININNMSLVTDANGGFRINIKADTGINNVTVRYNGSSMYNGITDLIVFTGLKHDTVITLGHMINDTKYDQTVEINGVLKDVNGTPVNNAAVLINDKEALTDDNGKFTIGMSVNVGINNITAVYNGNNKYNPSNATTTFNGLKHDTAITINEIPDTPYDNKVNITGTLTDTDTQTNIVDTELIININNITYTTTTDTLGKYSINNIPVIPESNNITVTYNGNKTYKNTNSTITFTGLAHNTTLTVNPINNTAIGNNITVTGTLEDTNSTRIDKAAITITLNNQNYTTETINGEYTINLKADTLNINNITLQYNGNSRYNPINCKTTFNVTKTNSIITTSNMTGHLGEIITLNATIKDTNNNTITTGKVGVKINGKTFGYTNIINGTIRFNVNLSPDNFGKYNYKVLFIYGGSDIHKEARQSTTLTITAFNPVFDVKITNATSIGSTALMTVKVSNGTGYNARSGTVGFKINGKTYKINGKAYTVKIKNGTATFKFNITKDMTGTKSITVTYSGNSQFNQNRTTIHNAITVKNKVTATTTNVKITIGENAVLKVGFTGTDGKAITSGKVAVKINGRTFGYTQIHNGTATYILKLDPKKFSARNYTVTFKYGGSSTYTEVAANTTLQITKHTTKFSYTTTTSYRNTTTGIILKIADDKNTVKADNGTVGLKINGKTYKVNGKAVTVKPVNGTVAFTVNTNNLKTNNNITFTYSGYREFTGLKQTYNNGLIIQQ